MRRILVISYYWPPTGGSGVQRWVKFSKYLPSEGWQPVIYTPSNPERLAVDESLAADVPPEAEIIRTPIREPYGAYRRISGKKGDAKGAGLNPINSQRKSFNQKLLLWIRSNFFVPDPRSGWVKPSLRFLKAYLAEHPVDAIVSTGPPQSMHLLGLALHRSTGIPWIADFRDPWTRMFYFGNLPLLPWVRRRHVRMEQEVLDGADAVVAVSPRVQADFAAGTSTPVHLITNGFDEEDFALPLPARNDGEFRIVHTGLFASDGNPLRLWEALAERCKADPAFRSALRIRLAGKVDPEISDAIREAGLGENLVLPGYLSHPDSVMELRTADLVLLPLRQSPEYDKVLPGKIFECLACGRPVLGIGPKDSAAGDLLSGSGAGIMADWDEDPSPAIDKLTVGGYGCSAGKAAPFTRRLLSKKMASLLEDITRK